MFTLDWCLLDEVDMGIHVGLFAPSMHYIRHVFLGQFLIEVEYFFGLACWGFIFSPGMYIKRVLKHVEASKHGH